MTFAGRLNPDGYWKEKLGLWTPDNRTTDSVPEQVCKQTRDFVNNLAPWSAHPFSLPRYASLLKNWDRRGIREY